MAFSKPKSGTFQKHFLMDCRDTCHTWILCNIASTQNIYTWSKFLYQFLAKMHLSHNYTHHHKLHIRWACKLQTLPTEHVFKAFLTRESDLFLICFRVVTLPWMFFLASDYRPFDPWIYNILTTRRREREREVFVFEVKSYFPDWVLISQKFVEFV